jgi:hypothetical protein
LWSTSPRLGKLPSDPDYVVTGCARIAPDAVAKALSANSAPTNLDSEKLVMDLVRSCTNIPVPYCEIVTDGKRSPFLVMEYIPGRLLVECWTELSWWKKLRIVTGGRPTFSHHGKCLKKYSEMIKFSHCFFTLENIWKIFQYPDI